MKIENLECVINLHYIYVSNVIMSLVRNRYTNENGLWNKKHTKI